MINRSFLAAVLATVTLPAFGLATTAMAAPHHPGHPRPGHHHGGPHHPGHPHRGPRHGLGPRFGFGSRPDGRFHGPRMVFRGDRRVIVRPYPVFVGGPVYRPAVPRYVGPGVPVAGGCSTRRNVSMTPYGWHRIVTIQTCIRP